MSPRNLTGWAAMAVGCQLEPLSYPEPELGPDDVRVAVSHCGLCFTDVHAIDDWYGVTRYPFVPGHEVVGFVEARGASVDWLREGDRVGVGWQGRSCGRCGWCACGEEQLCHRIARMGTCDRHGGFGPSVTVDARFAHALPPEMAAETAAILMCGGISAYTPLRAYAEPGSRIGILGIGGVGHLAIQFAHAFGCEVVALSSSPAKEEEAKGFGADAFVDTGNPAALEELEETLDILLWTGHGEADWGRLLDTPRKRGRIVLLGFPPVSFNPTDVVVHELSIAGSFLGNRRLMPQMLAFAQAHGITPVVEQLPLARVNEAITRLRENRVRYRFVLRHEDVPT